MSTEDKILELVKSAHPENPIEYVDSIVRPFARNKLDSLLKLCKDCPASKLTDIKSLTYGDDQASVMIINEGIYHNQIRDNKIVYPLQDSEEMALIDTLLDTYHINKRQLFWMNAVNCYTCTEINGKIIERTPNSHEADFCRGYIDRAIEIIHPVMIILLGNIPLNLFMRGKTIKEMHGKLIDVNGVKAMPMYSPHSLIQMNKNGELEELIDEYETEFCNDFKNAFKYVQDNFKGNVVLQPLA